MLMISRRRSRLVILGFSLIRGAQPAVDGTQYEPSLIVSRIRIAPAGFAPIMDPSLRTTSTAGITSGLAFPDRGTE